VIFCIFYGVALQTIKDKAPLLSMLDTVPAGEPQVLELDRAAGADRCLRVVCRHRRHDEPVNLAKHEPLLVLFLIGTAVLAFWVSPALIAALAPVAHREVIVELRCGARHRRGDDALVAALPFVVEATRKLADRCGIEDPERDEIIRTKPVGRLSARPDRQLLRLSLLLFAAYYYKVPLEGRDQALLR